MSAWATQPEQLNGATEAPDAKAYREYLADLEPEETALSFEAFLDANEPAGQEEFNNQVSALRKEYTTLDFSTVPQSFYYTYRDASLADSETPPPTVFYADPAAPFTHDFLAGIAAGSVYSNMSGPTAQEKVVVLGDPKFDPIWGEGGEKMLADPVTFNPQDTTFGNFHKFRFAGINRDNAVAKREEIVTYLRNNNLPHKVLFVRIDDYNYDPQTGNVILNYGPGIRRPTYAAWFFTSPDFVTGLNSILQSFGLQWSERVLDDAFDANNTYILEQL